MVGSVRSALILLAACSPPAIERPPAAVPKGAMGDIGWPVQEKMPDLPPAVDLDAPLASMVVTRFGPPRRPLMADADATKLRDRLATLKGPAKLEALDRLAEHLDVAADIATDDDMLADLRGASDAYTALIAEPGFAKYATADQVLYRAARIEFELEHRDDGAAEIRRIFADYPRSRWIAEAYALIGAALTQADPKAALGYLDEVAALGRPPLTDYARYERLAALESLMRYAEELTEATNLAASSEPLREPAMIQSLRAFAQSEEPSAAVRIYDALDHAHLPTILRRLSDAYFQAGKLDAAATVLADLLASTDDPLELCATHGRMFELDIVVDHQSGIREARVWVEQAKRTNDPRCNRLVDAKVAGAAIDISVDADADPLWQLAIEIATTPERKAAALRNRAYLVWRVARGRKDAEGWLNAAAALDAAFAVTHDPKLEAGAALARNNARVGRSKK